MQSNYVSFCRDEVVSCRELLLLFHLDGGQSIGEIMDIEFWLKYMGNRG